MSTTTYIFLEKSENCHLDTPSYLELCLQYRSTEFSDQPVHLFSLINLLCPIDETLDSWLSSKS